MHVQVLSSTVPAHGMCQTLLILFTFWDAGLHPDEASSALKYRACAQNVLDVIHSRYILGGEMQPELIEVKPPLPIPLLARSCPALDPRTIRVPGGHKKLPGALGALWRPGGPPCS